MIRIEGLKKFYNDLCVLDIPFLEFKKGEIYCLLGLNGAGKTTLLNILASLDEPSSGKVIFEIDRRKIGYLRQDPYLFEGSIFYNVNMTLSIRGIKDKKKVLSILDELGISNIKDKNKREISYGELKRASFARAIVHNPELLLLDEPTANIDSQSKRLIEDFIKKLNKQGTTIIFSTQDLSSGCRITENLISLIDGKIKFGSIENLFPCVLPQGDGLKEAKISDKLGIWVITEEEGPAHILISPTEIVVSREYLVSSCRNSLLGNVVKIEEKRKDMLALSVDVDGIIFHATITPKSLFELSITVGSTVYLSFKASEVNVLK